MEDCEKIKTSFMLLIHASLSPVLKSSEGDLRLSCVRAYEDINRRRFNCSYISPSFYLTLPVPSTPSEYLNKREDAAKRRQPHITDVKRISCE